MSSNQNPGGCFFTLISVSFIGAIGDAIRVLGQTHL